MEVDEDLAMNQAVEKIVDESVEMIIRERRLEKIGMKNFEAMNYRVDDGLVFGLKFEGVQSFQITDVNDNQNFDVKKDVQKSFTSVSKNNGKSLSKKEVEIEKNVQKIIEYYTRSRCRKLEDLPIELVVKIFSYLSKRDLFRNVRRVSPKWNAMASEVSLWHDISSGPEVSSEELSEWLINAKQLQSLTLMDRQDTGLILKHVSKYNKALRSIQILNCWGTYKQPTIPSVPLCNLLLRCPKLRTVNMTGCKLASCKFFKLLGNGDFMKNRKGVNTPTTKDLRVMYLGPINTKQLRCFLQGRRNPGTFQIITVLMERSEYDVVDEEEPELYALDESARFVDVDPLE